MRKIIFYILHRLIGSLHQDAQTQPAKTKILRQVSRIEGFETYLKNRIVHFTKHAGLQAASQDELQFHRGVVFGYQQLLSSMKIARTKKVSDDEKVKQ